jgi:hypothetical protein
MRLKTHGSLAVCRAKGKKKYEVKQPLLLSTDTFSGHHHEFTLALPYR